MKARAAISLGLSRAERRFLKTMIEGGRACDLPGADTTREALLVKGLVRRPPRVAFVVLTPAGLDAVFSFRSRGIS